LHLAHRLRNPTVLTVALYSAAIVWWENDPTRAAAALEEAFGYIRAGASDLLYADMLELRARIETMAGQGTSALAALRAGLAQSVESGNRPSVVSSQWYLVEMLATSGHDLDTAAMLHGITIYGPLAEAFPAFGGREAQLHDQALAALRAQLGDKRFEDLVERGAALSFEEGVDSPLPNSIA